MGFLRNLLIPLAKRYKSLDVRTQKNIVLALSLTDLGRRTVATELLPEILAALPNSITPSQQEQITMELLVGLVGCLQIPPPAELALMWDLDGEGLRQMVGMLVFAENNDPRQILANANYSGNSDEARTQTMLAIARMVNRDDPNLVTRLNTPELARKWADISRDFISGAITGYQRVPHSAVVDRIALRLSELTPRGRALVDELLQRRANHGRNPHTRAPRKLQAEELPQIEEIEDLIYAVEKIARKYIKIPPPDPMFGSAEVDNNAMTESVVPFVIGLLTIKLAQEFQGYIASPEQSIFNAQLESVLLKLRLEVSASIARSVNKMWRVVDLGFDVANGPEAIPDHAKIQAGVRETFEKILNAIIVNNQLHPQAVAIVVDGYVNNAPFLKDDRVRPKLGKDLTKWANNYLNSR